MSVMKRHACMHAYAGMHSSSCIASCHVSPFKGHLARGLLSMLWQHACTSHGRADRAVQGRLCGIQKLQDYMIYYEIY